MMCQLSTISTDCCSICGNNHRNADCTYVTITEHVPDNIVPSRAKLSLPHSMKLELLADGTYCVKTQQNLNKGTKFGPLQAEKSTGDPGSVFCVRIFAENDPLSMYLDFSDENKCNWMIFINPAEYLEEQNLICYQDQDEIFYVAIKEISAGQPLKVWYSPYYGSKMGKDMLELRKTDDILKNIDVDDLIKDQQNIMDREVWTCKLCGQVEYRIVSFAKHMVNHYSAQLKKHCELCNSTFTYDKSLKNHLKIVHNTNAEEPPLPEKCDTITNVHNEDLAVGGPLLNDIFNDSSDLPQSDLNQFEMDLDDPNLLLDSSDNITDNLRDLDHFNFEIDDNQKSFVCDVCLKHFTKLKYLVQHMRKHTGEFICVHCMKVFCRRENFDGHICNASTNLTCIFCDKTFTLKKYLSRHVAGAHFGKYKCTKCLRNYHSNKELNEHNCQGKSSEEKETFTCNICDKAFYRSSYLKRHLKTHAKGERNHDQKSQSVCEECGADLQNPNSYYLHKKKHTIDGLTCQVCEKKFCRKDALLAHNSIHERNVQTLHDCKICHKTFKTAKILQAHVKSTHLNQKQFKCTECPVSFKQKCSLKKHFQVAHEKKGGLIRIDCYSCPICDTQMKLKSSLLRHIQNFHPDHKNQSDDTTKQPNDTTESTDAEVQINQIETDSETRQQSNNEICLSIPELGEEDEEIKLDNNAYIMENGNIVQPNGEQVVIYLLNSNT